MAALVVSIVPGEGRLSFSRMLVVGSLYELTVAGVDGAVELIITDHRGNALAASAAGELSLATMQMQDAFRGRRHCPTAMVLHVYAYVDQAVVAEGAVIVRWAPFVFEGERPLPISMKGDAGEAGKSAYASWLMIPEHAGKTEAEFADWLKGERGEPGEAGKNGMYVPALGNYAFAVLDDGHLVILTQDDSRLFAKDAGGNPDYNKPLYVITAAGHLAYQFWTGDAVTQTIDLGTVVGPRGPAFRYVDFTPEQLAALKGEPGTDGTDGLTEAQVQTVVEAYGYATAAAVALKADQTALALKADQTALLNGLAVKQDVLYYDAVPTAGSTAVMTSGALKTRLDQVDADIHAAKGVQMDEVVTLLSQLFSDVSDTVPRGFGDIHSVLEQIVRRLKGV